jgi:hypothetical protein
MWPSKIQTRCNIEGESPKRTRVVALVGFIGFAFSSRGDNTNFGPSQNDGQADGAHGGFDGHTG